jgi:hypothetical protein
MLKAWQVGHIRYHLKSGRSQRWIAHHARVARGTVFAIARREHKAERQLRAQTAALAALELPDLNQPPRRCPTCRALVYMPCLACSILRSEGLTRLLAAQKKRKR